VNGPSLVPASVLGTAQPTEKATKRLNRFLLWGLTLAASVMLAVGLTADAEAARTKRCGTIVITSEETLTRVTVTARGVSCRYARQFLLRQKRRGITPRGWRCSAAGVELYCRRGAQRISHGPPFETLGPASHGRVDGGR